MTPNGPAGDKENVLSHVLTNMFTRHFTDTGPRGQAPNAGAYENILQVH
jgi:hypothetical protein